MTIKATVAKWGNSYAVRIPRTLIKENQLQEGSDIEFTFTPVPTQRKNLTLKQLLKGMDRKNRHEEIDWGPPVGKEIW